MHEQPARAGELRNRLDVRKRQYLPTGGVLERDQPGAREMRIVRFDRRRDVLKPHASVRLVLHRLRLDGPEHRHPAAFPPVGVPHLANDRLFAALALAHQRDQVCLGSGRCVQRFLETQ
jgi:hypothetical protein